MRPRFTLPALLAMILLAFSLIGGTGLGAQEATPEGLQPEDLEGLQHSVVRGYSIDYSAMLDTVATPGAEMTMPSGVLSLSAVILEFDDAGNAETALGQLAEDAGPDFLGEGEEIAEIDLGLGDNSVPYGGIEDFEGQEMESVITIVQAGNYVYFSYGVGSGEDMQSIVSDFTNGLIENEGSGEGEFNEDGTSSGGP